MTHPIRALIAALAATLVLGGLAAPYAGGRTAQAAPNDPYTHPVPPPKCTRAQADSGNVGACLLAFYNDPADDGYGVPPAPGVGSGWNWNGSTYNGSPALAEFEANITTNSQPVGALPTGYLETHKLARALFEGFLAEVQAKGYAVRHASGYGYRCTGTWSCPGGDTRDLSLHAWGLAIDMNSDANPIRTYSSQNGQSACLTPVETDLPEWAIRTAERWGLYWGGYGWNTGCNVAGAERTSAVRDAPHFEFRGTPQQAKAIAEYNYANNPDLECFATVAADGGDAQQCTLTGRPDAGWRLPVDADPPAGATAALVNVTATDATAAGFLTLESCGAHPAAARTTSTLTYAPGEVVATLAIAPLSSDGRFCVYRASAVHSVVDVVAYLADSQAPGSAVEWFQPTTPTRLLDTRSGSALAGNAEREIPGATGDLLVNLAAVADAGPGFLQAGECASLGSDAAFSNVNYLGRTAGAPSVRSNLTLVSTGSDSATDTAACVFALSATHVVVDALGTLVGDDSDDGLGWEVAPARRVLDTRQSTAAWSQGLPAAGALIPVNLGTDAPAAAVAITVTGGEQPGFVSLGSCADLQAQLAAGGSPTTSNLNHLAGQTVTNLAITSVDDGELCAYTQAATHVILDVQAELTTTRTVGLLSVAPHRLHDSREVAGPDSSQT